MTKKILAIGNAIVDIVCKIDDEFLAKNSLVKGSMSLIDEKTADKLSELKFEKIVSGGSASNTISLLSKLGNKNLFIGKVGNDKFGEKFIQEITKENSEFLTDKNLQRPTARSFILVSPDGERTMCTFLGCAPEILENDIKEEFFKDVSILYLEGYLWDSIETINALKKSIKLAKENNVKIAFSLSDLFCVSRHKEDFLNLILNDLDIVFANENEALELDENYVEVFLKNKKLIAIVTKSANGCEIFYEEKSIKVPTNNVEKVIDTTGAGDVFAGGFLYEYLKNSSLEICAKTGNEMAGKIIQQFGARFN